MHTGQRLHTVLASVGAGCYNKMPRTEGLRKNRKFISHRPEGCEVQDQGRADPWRLPALSSHGGWDRGALPGLFYAGANPTPRSRALFT